MKLIKHEEMRKNNTLNVLVHLRENGPETKKDVQNGTGLSWGAVSNIIEKLSKNKIIVENIKESSSVGRTPQVYDINTDKNLLIGLDINIRGITAVLMDLKSNIDIVISENLNRKDKSSVILQIKKIISEIIMRGKSASKSIIGIGVALQGAVDADRGVSIYIPTFSDWEEVPIQSILEKEFDLPVRIDHDPNCLALAEYWLGNVEKAENMIMLRLSMGIGACIMVNQEIYSGANGNAGEFGHMIMNPSGPVCSCKSHGCLEVYSSVRGILQQARQGIKDGLLDIENIDDDNECNFVKVVEAARGGNTYLKEVFNSAGEYLGIAIANLINLFNPQLIVLGGELSLYDDLLIDQVKKVAKKNAWRYSQVNIIKSRIGSDAAAIGAASLFLQEIFSGELKHIMQT